MEKNQDSDRRGFFDKIAKLGVAGGVATLLLGKIGENTLLPSAKAGVDGDLILGVVNPAVPPLAPANTTLFGPVGAPGGVLFIQNTLPVQGLIGTTEAIVAAGIPPGPMPVGVHGAALGGMGVRGESISGTGVCGYATASTGNTVGTYGESASEAGIGVKGYVTASTGTTYGVYGETASESGTAIFGTSTSQSGGTYGIWGQSTSINGTGVGGAANASTGTTSGVYGNSASVSGRGVYGLASASTGTTYGVIGSSQSENGRGVYGFAGALTGSAYGVFGYCNSESGRGVFGNANTSTGTAYGVYGYSASINGTGVYGFENASTGTTYGVYGLSNSISGRGVYGQAGASTGTTYGVYGQSDSQSGVSIMGQAGNATAKSIVARGTSGQIANLQEWIDFTATILSAVSKDGYIGVGTSSPSTPIHVKSSSSNPAVRLENENQHVGQFIYCYSNGNIPFFSGRRARGTTASPTAVQTDDVLMRYGGAGYGSTTFPPGNRAILEFRAAEAWTDAAQGTYILLSTTPTGSNTAAERMRITSDGSIGVNTTSFGSGAGVIAIKNATTTPSVNPSGGGVLYVENGALKYRGSSGTVTTLASA